MRIKKGTGIGMDFFEKLGKTISGKSKEAVKKAQDLAEISNLSLQISSQEKVRAGAYEELGKRYYEQNKDKPDEMYASQFETIKTASEKILKLKEDIMKARGKKSCLNCGAEMDEEAEYCPKCGTKYTSAEAGEAAEEEEAEEDFFEKTPEESNEQVDEPES